MLRVEQSTNGDGSGIEPRQRKRDAEQGASRWPVDELDRPTAELLRSDDDPSLPPPTIHVHAEHVGWSLGEPVGQQTSDMLASNGEQLVVRTRGGVAEAEAARVVLLARICGAE